MQSNGLRFYLTATTFKQLAAILAVHGLQRAAGDTKADVVEQLYQLLTNVNTLTSIVTQLDTNAKEALRRLMAADNALPLHTFEEYYGPVRSYKPWRKDGAAGVSRPWLTPISITETLWYLGLIYRDPPKPKPGLVQHYILPAELATLLAEIMGGGNQRIGETSHVESVPYPGRNGPLLHHLAIWLATVHAGVDGHGVKPVHGRWLPPSVVALLCARLGLDRDDGYRPIRSERHHPYLAFLHYLALAAELVTVTSAAMQLTPTAWLWLNAEQSTRQQQLQDAWQTTIPDLAQHFRFDWEPLSVQARALIMEAVSHLTAQDPQPLTQLVAQWRLLDAYKLLPAPRPRDWRDESSLYDPVAALIAGPLFWLGMVGLVQNPRSSGPASLGPEFGDERERSALFVQRQSSMVNATAVVHCRMPKQPANTVLAPLNVQPVHLVRLARFCEWQITTEPTPSPHTFTLSADRIAQLAAQGIAPAQLLAQLTDALGRPPSRRLIQRVKNWAKAGQQLRFRVLFVLEADEADRLARVRRHKLVRNRLREPLAPNRIALDPADAPALAQTLRTLGYVVEPPSFPPPTSPATGTEERAEGAEDRDELSRQLQWFLITLYQALGEQIALPVDLPWAIRQTVRRQLPLTEQASAEAMAQLATERLQAALNGYLQLPAWDMAATVDPH